jgi:cellulose synthase/poly-beta-1,6-N-acetylglucosamine synthase-like glycosyltransferase
MASARGWAAGRPRIAIAIPVKDEEADLPACLAALDAAAAAYPGEVTIVAIANNCSDSSVSVLQTRQMRHARLRWAAVSLLPRYAHAGWARRLALDAAAALLHHPGDLLLSTDADTCVDPDWITRIVAHVRAGADAVAGRALTRRIDRARLGPAASDRLNLLGRYYTALDWLRADAAPDADDPWPRHFYEGGASIAVTLAMYRRIGGAPTPPLAEDRALFAAVRAAGGRVRHPLDVRVFTSCRLSGRAPGGMADAFATWIDQPADAPLHETYAVDAALGEAASATDQLSFATLPAAVAEAQRRISARRSAPLPQVEPILVMPLGRDDADCVAEPVAEFRHRFVATFGVIGFAQPVNQQEVAA